MNERIREVHLARRAVLYVRQSSTFQVMHYAESRRLQYAMRGRIEELGWHDVEIIDGDQGVSAAGEAERAGFDRLVSEVGLGRVGVVAARELSRLARNNRDWQRLVEICRVVDTLLLDHETLYDARRGNDRLLLGLKGSLNEYELDVLRLRSQEARYAKAARGELVTAAPVGYIRLPEQRLQLTPDLRVQAYVRLVFSKFLELGTARQVMAWFVGHGLTIPCARPGTDGREVIWRSPYYGALAHLLKNPVYAGVYVYGRQVTERRVVDGVVRKASKRKSPDQWRTVIADHHESYVDRDTFDRIQRMLADNLASTAWSRRGAAKRGAALLAGILRCRRCGRRLTVAYTGRVRENLRYACHRGHLDRGESRCLSFGGTLPDREVGRAVLRALEPAALEAARVAAEEERARGGDVLRARRLEVQEAHYRAERARRHYEAADPEHRLVASELERRWNEALTQAAEASARLGQDLAGHGTDSLAVPSEAELTALADDLSRVWDDEHTDWATKKRIVRTLVEEIVVDTDADRRELVFLMHWKGGAHTEIRLPWRRRGFSSAHTPEAIVAGVRELVKISDDEYIAGCLNRNGLKTGYGREWSKTAVVSLRAHHHIRVHSPERRRAEGWLTLTEASALAGVSTVTLRRCQERGEVAAIRPFPVGPYIFRRADLTEEFISQLASRVAKHNRWGRRYEQKPGTLFESST